MLIPRIASKSSTRRNRPLFCRASIILFAVTGPTPGNSSNSLIVAAFEIDRLSRGRLLALRSCDTGQQRNQEQARKETQLR